ncbi:putative DNA-binding domain-containing protein [Limnohabitans sp.]|uniref:HvfC/BufC family peptide modification chaperone n=1 Tax=Limnohabitans sp. TaxID=1907725 RepID=UPI0033425D21
MLNNFRQTQFALARYLRDPLSAPLPAGVKAVDANACSQVMVDYVSNILAPVFPVTRAALGEALWCQAVHLFLKDAACHTPWNNAVQRAFMTHVSANAERQQLPAWLKDVAHFEWLQTTGYLAALDETAASGAA